LLTSVPVPVTVVPEFEALVVNCVKLPTDGAALFGTKL